MNKERLSKVISFNSLDFFILHYGEGDEDNDENDNDDNENDSDHNILLLSFHTSPLLCAY